MDTIVPFAPICARLLEISAIICARFCCWFCRCMSSTVPSPSSFCSPANRLQSMDCFTPKRNEDDPIPNQDVCFQTLNKLTAISTSPRVNKNIADPCVYCCLTNFLTLTPPHRSMHAHCPPARPPIRTSVTSASSSRSAAAPSARCSSATRAPMRTHCLLSR